MTPRIEPMLAVVGEPPTQNGVLDSFWGEIKFDGFRLTASIDPEGVRLTSRAGRPMTETFPELARALGRAAAGRALVIDGEVVAPQPAGGPPDFERLQARSRARPSTALQAKIPVQLVVFDLMHLDGTDLTGLPLLRRRELLDTLHLDLEDELLLSPTFTGVARALRPRRRSTLDDDVVGEGGRVVGPLEHLPADPEHRA